MKSRSALRILAEVTESQWGMVTSAQAIARGVSHANLTRLTSAGDLVRLTHGVYKDAGAPSDEHQALRAAWLAVEPERLVWDRLEDRPSFATVSGESAAVLYQMGDLRAARSEFTTRTRKQTQRGDIRFRTAALTSRDVTVRSGLPVTTPERTIADLVEARTQLDHVGNALRDAARQSQIDTEYLTELLAKLAERNGHRKGDGEALLQQLFEAAHIDAEHLAEQIAPAPDLAALITSKYITSLDTSELRAALQPVLDTFASVEKATVQTTVPAMQQFLRTLAERVAMHHTIRTENTMAQISKTLLRAADAATLTQNTTQSRMNHEENES